MSQIHRLDVSDGRSDFARDEIVRMPRDRRLTGIPEEAREQLGARDQRPPVKQFVARQLDGTESDWNYRGRSESEEAHAQPFGAPECLASQKHKGFQRFYRAVVSPTHVRVTAGGRIVPNNRGTSSPTSKWDKDKSIPESVLTQPSLDRLPPPPQTGYAYPPVPYGGFPTMYPSFVPGIGHAMHHPTGAFPYLPWQVGANMGGAIAMPMAPPPHPAEMGRMHGSSKDSSQSDKRSESGVSDRARHSRNSHPEQLDPMRGPIYPSQWMMPSAPPFYHLGIGPPPVFPTSTLPNPAMLPHPMTIHQAGHMGMPGVGQPGENDAPFRNPVSTVEAATASTTPAMPPITSIRPSAITTKHIEILRTRLKHLEDQLQYNKHQIDERAFQRDAQMMRQQIQQFEKNLEQQLLLEEAQCPKAPKKSVTPKPEVDKSFKGWYYGPNATYGGAFSSSADNFIDRPQYYNNPEKKTTSRPKHGNKTTKSTLSDWTPLSMPLDGLSTMKTEKSTLPAGAALAAPFQPRGVPVATQMPESAESIRRATASSESADTQSPPTERDCGSGGRVAWGTDALTVPGHNEDRPYLVGYMSAGGKKHDAHRDYMYGRELTDDELRARQMYWGKIPRHHQQKGLPKFDGKDFFPPSPVKTDSLEKACTSKSPVHHSDSIHQDGQAADTVPKSADNDPFKALGVTGPILSRNGPGNSTQSESLPGPQDVMAKSTSTGPMRQGQRTGRVGRSLDGANNVSVDSTPSSSNATKGNTSSDKVEEDQELLFTGRRTMNRAQ